MGLRDELASVIDIHGVIVYLCPFFFLVANQ